MLYVARPLGNTAASVGQSDWSVFCARNGARVIESAQSVSVMQVREKKVADCARWASYEGAPGQELPPVRGSITHTHNPTNLLTHKDKHTHTHTRLVGW